MDMEESTQDSCEIMCRRVVVSNDVLVEVSTYNLNVSKVRDEYPLAYIRKEKRLIPMHIKVSIDNVIMISWLLTLSVDRHAFYDVRFTRGESPKSWLSLVRLFKEVILFHYDVR